MMPAVTLIVKCNYQKCEYQKLDYHTNREIHTSDKVMPICPSA